MSSLVKMGFLPLKNTIFLVCDMQESYRRSIVHFDKVVNRACLLCQASRLLQVPLLVTEQSSESLGCTVDELDLGHAVGIFSKTQFSMINNEVCNQMNCLCGGKVEAAVLMGFEAHTGIEQTAHDLIERLIKVHVACDAVSSRTQEDRRLALERMAQVGCALTTSETILYGLMRDRQFCYFRQVANMLKHPMKPSGLVSS